MEGKKVRIECVKNGPYVVKKGEEVIFALCRCGASKNKPYCDGEHAKIGFKADEKNLEI